MRQGGIRGHGFSYLQCVLLGSVFSEHRELLLEEQLQVFKLVSHLGFYSCTFLVFRGRVDILGTSGLLRVLPDDSCTHRACSGFQTYHRLGYLLCYWLVGWLTSWRD